MQAAWLDAIPVAIFVVQQRVVAANRAAADLIGCAPHELVGMSLDALFDGAPDAAGTTCWLKPRAGVPIPVELTNQPIEHDGAPARLLTVQRAAQPDLYRAAIEGSADSFYLLRVQRAADGSITDLIMVDASESAVRLTGLTREQLLGHSALALVPPNIGATLLDDFAAQIAPGSPAFHEYYFHDHLIRTGWYQVQFIPLENDQFAVFVRDITESKESETVVQQLGTEIEQQARLLDEILGATPDGFILFDRAGRYLYVNKSGLANSGLTADQIIGKTWRELGFPEEVGLLFESRLEHVFTTGESITYEEQFPTTRGLRDFLTTQTPIHDKDGKVILLLNTIRDITERKQAEMALEMSEQRLTSILNSMQDAVWSVQADKHQLFYTNAAIQDITGYSAADFTGNQHLLVDIVHPEDRARFADQLSRVAQDDIDTEYRIIRRDGETRWVHNRFWVVSSLQGERIDGIMTDITDRKQASEAAMQLAIERERVHILSEFVRDASHEFRTPLSIIHTRLYLMEKILDPQKHLEYIGGIKEQAERILTLVESLITMSRLDSATKMQFERLNLNHLLANMNAKTGEEAARKDLAFSLELAPEALYMHGEMDELRVALNAIFENAVSYTPPGGRISVRTYRRDDDEIAVDVRDSGVGISSAEMAHIFERFYRVDQAHSQKGFGLGLPIARKIVEMHHGHIEVESVPGQGSVFRLIFPAAPMPAAVPQRAAVRSSS